MTTHERTDRMTTPICFIDTETDGVHPGRNPWEIAIIRREPGEPTAAARVWRTFVDIDLSDTPDGFGLGIGGFDDRHPMGRHVAHGDPWSVASFAEPDYRSARDAAFDVARL